MQPTQAEPSLGPAVGWGAARGELQTELTRQHLAAEFKRQLLGSPRPLSLR